jgi:hypothetical protein
MAKKVSPLKKTSKAPVKKAKAPTQKTAYKTLISPLSKPTPQVRRKAVPLPTEVNNRKIGAIKREIEKHLSNCDTIRGYSNWYVGITNDTARRRLEHRTAKKLTDCVYFKSWDVGTKEQSAIVESHFHKKGMLDKHGSRGAVDTSKYVYVFKAEIGFVDAIFHLLGLI